MSSLTTETKEVWVVIRHDTLGHSSEVYECQTEEEAVIAAREAVIDFVSKFNCFYWCTIEHRIEPIYK